jgi:hypothetical protein
MKLQGMKKGLHYIVCFTMRGAGMKTLIRQCQLNETIIRQMIIAHSQQIFDATVAAINGAVQLPQRKSVNRTLVQPARGRLTEKKSSISTMRINIPKQHIRAQCDRQRIRRSVGCPERSESWLLLTKSSLSSGT